MRAGKQMSQKRNLSTGLDLDSNKKRIEPEEFIYIDTWCYCLPSCWLVVIIIGKLNNIN
jgi:hypothetical protein